MTDDPPAPADVCIVGAGAAGLTLATALVGSGLDVLVVEGGEWRPKPGPDPLLEGETEGFAFRGLSEGRARVVGGAATLWFGQCMRLPAIDFEARPWVEGSGWPLTPAELEPHYRRAEELMGIDQPLYDGGAWRAFGIPAPGFDGERLVPHFTIRNRRPDLGRRLGGPLRRAREVRFLTGTTVTHLDAAEGGAAVRSARAVGPGGEARRIAARVFVLCGGGIENARLLLASDDMVRGGIGNGADLVGRFLQDHPSARTARVRPADTAALQEVFAHRRRGALRWWPKLELSAAAQRRHRALNADGYVVYDYGEASSAEAVKALLRGRADGARTPRRAAASRILRDAPRLFAETARAAAGRRTPFFPPSAVWLQAFVEQPPDPANRVRLSDARDRLGARRARIEWRLREAERATLELYTRVVGDEFARLGLGAVEPEPWLSGSADDLMGRVEDAYHHAGTTRMADDPRRGVVDRDGRVHGVCNLYVAGGSVFPTSGYGNPVLTVMAVALRLGDHLAASGPPG